MAHNLSLKSLPSNQKYYRVFIPGIKSLAQAIEAEELLREY